MKTLVFELLRGKGVWRAMLYGAMRSSVIQPQLPVLDVACGVNPGYMRIFGLSRSDIEAMDIYHAAHPSVIHDVSRAPFPYAEEAFESVFLINCLYAFPDPLHVMREARRVLRPSGKAFMSFPLAFPYTPEPHDFFRFTEEGVRRLCSDAGFAIISIAPLGGRWITSAYILSPFLRPYWLFAFPLYMIAFVFDKIASVLFPRLPAMPIGYFVIAKPV